MVFILVEDDLRLIERIKNIITKEMFNYDFDYEIKVYDDFNSTLREEISSNSKIKTYILSVDLKQGISGIDIAQYIRKKDWDSNIIFVTNHGNMFETVHRKVINVIEFIEKYHDMDYRLSKDIKKIIINSLDKETLNYKYLSSYYRILFKSIKYIKRDSKTRKLLIHTKNSVYESNMSIKDALKELDKRFKRVSRSMIINSDYINEINWNKGYIKLLDGHLINNISKSYK